MFSLSVARREVLGSVGNLPDDYFGEGPKKPETQALRQTVIDALCEQVKRFFREGGQVAVYDASNTRQTQRERIQEEFAPLKVQIMFLGTCAAAAR